MLSKGILWFLFIFSQFEKSLPLNNFLDLTDIPDSEVFLSSNLAAYEFVHITNPVKGNKIWEHKTRIFEFIVFFL